MKNPKSPAREDVGAAALDEDELLDDELLDDDTELDPLGDAVIPGAPVLRMATLRFEIPHLAERYRVDSWLSRHIKYATRHRVQKAIAEGRVAVNGHPVKNSYGLLSGDVVEVQILRPSPADMLAEDMPLEILYEDTHLVVLVKPPGIAVHPTYRHWSGTLANGLLYHFQQHTPSGEPVPVPGLIHRLDKFTSGLLVVGKTAEAKRQLSAQFAQRRTRKRYQALVWGVPRAREGLLETNLGISAHSRMVMDVYPYGGSRGKTARTGWKLERDLGRFSLLDVELFTGRTHQIRAHLRHLGHPILGDHIYGGQTGEGYRFAGQQQWLPQLLEIIPRQALHAAFLGFYHPISREWLEFQAPLPADIRAALDWLAEWAGSEKA